MNLSCKTCRFFITYSFFENKVEREGFSTPVTELVSYPACASGGNLTKIDDDPDEHVCPLWTPRSVVPNMGWWTLSPVERLRKANVNITKNKKTVASYLVQSVIIACPQCGSTNLELTDEKNDVFIFKCLNCRSKFGYRGK